jgi:hypothetical protein
MRFKGAGHAALATALVGGAVAGACSGCSPSASGTSSGSPALVVCGQTLWNAAAGANLDDLTTGDAKITSVSAGFLLFLKVSGSCQAGASLNWEPSSAAKIVQSARASDGKLAAVDLQPLAKTFTLILTSSAGRESRIPVSLSALPVLVGTPTAPSTPPRQTSP